MILLEVEMCTPNITIGIVSSKVRYFTVHTLLSVLFLVRYQLRFLGSFETLAPSPNTKPTYLLRLYGIIPTLLLY